MRTLLKYAGVLIWVGLAIVAVTAQDSQPRVITQDEVYAVAERMYCPVCENIPLDDCQTPTCIQWKIEIESLLRAGWTSDDIVNDFVQRYGQHVVGVPQDPTLRSLSFVFPLVGGVLGLAVALWLLSRWRTQPVASTATATVADENPYRAMIERDLGN